MKTALDHYAYFIVLNAAQCEGLPEDIAVVTPPPPGMIEPQVDAETWLDASGGKRTSKRLGTTTDPVDKAT